MNISHIMLHLHGRGFIPSQSPYGPLYRWYIDAGEGVVVFLLFDFKGALAGYQQYRPEAPKQHRNPKQARYFTRARRQLCWGNYLPLRSGAGPVFLTESIFKSVALHRAGYNSWAVLGSSISPALKQQLDLLPYDFRCIGDGDEAGIKFSHTFARGFFTERKDLDEMTVWEIRQLIETERQKW